MNITKTLLEDILNESLAKDSSDLPNAAKRHTIHTNGGGEDSHADNPKLGAGKTATASPKVKEHLKHGTQHFVIKDAHGRRVMSIHDKGDSWDAVHPSPTNRNGSVYNYKRSEIDSHIDDSLHSHAKVYGLDRNSFTMHPVQLNTAKRSEKSEKQQERQTANAGSTEHIDKHDAEMHKHIAALLDAHHAMTSTSNKDDSHEHLSNLTRHLDKIKSAATNFHSNCCISGKDSIDKDSDGFKGRLDAAHKDGSIARGKK